MNQYYNLIINTTIIAATAKFIKKHHFKIKKGERIINLMSFWRNLNGKYSKIIKKGGNYSIISTFNTISI